MKKGVARYIGKFLFALCLLFCLAPDAGAQYFGQNKMRYKKLNFKVYDTPHFNLYHYLDNESMMKWLAKESEVWYELHQQVFQDTFAISKTRYIFLRPQNSYSGHWLSHQNPHPKCPRNPNIFLLVQDMY